MVSFYRRERLDLKFTMQNCPGWSYAGGPWIEPENAMRHLVRSRTDINGGQTVNVRLIPAGIHSNRPDLPWMECLSDQKRLILPPKHLLLSTCHGTPFLRLQTWWQHMPHFTDYLARCNYMLESGKPVSDVLLNRLSVKNGQLVTPEGISYRVLWLYDCKRMLPETLEKILSFAKQGVTIVGEPPSGIATLSGGEANKARFKKAVEDGYTHVKMNLPAGTSCFVVFRGNTVSQAEKRLSVTENPLSTTEKTEIQNDWEVSFPEGWGIEQPSIEIDQLMAWKDIPTLSAEGRAFSGTAVYRTTFRIGDTPDEARYLLDLGRVEMIAKVNLNGSDVATKWTYPYTMDITEYLQAGENRLEIAVTGTWFNRLVYDAGLPEQDRKTWTISGPQVGSPLKDYGLLGPVTIVMK